MTVGESNTTTDELRPTQPLRRARRRPAPPASSVWRFGFPLFLVVSAVAIVLLVLRGADLVLDSTDGELRAALTDPTAPGFEAFVEPTDSFLIIHTNDAGTATGATVIALASSEGSGGTVVHLPASLVVPIEGDCGPGEICIRFLSDAYDDGGAESLRSAVEGLFDVGFSDFMVVRPDQLAGLFEPVAPLPFVLADDLESVAASGVRTTRFRAGNLQLSADDAAALFGMLEPEEIETVRLARQQDLWTSWLTKLGETDDPAEALPALDLEVVTVLASLTDGTVRQEPVPFSPSRYTLNDGTPLVLVEPDEAAVLQLSNEIFPFPTPVTPGDRPAIRLLNGTTDEALMELARATLVENRTAIAVIGNAPSLDLAFTEVSYGDPTNEAAAEVLAEALGGAEVLFDQFGSTLADLTVVVGADFATLVG